MKVHKHIQGMTLVEVIIAMLLLSILMMSVAFSGTSVLLAVKNRVNATSTYVLAMNRALALTASKAAQSFANSATFSVTNNVINYLEAVTGSDGFTLKPATIDFNKELTDVGVNVTGTAVPKVTVAVTTSATDPNIVVVSLSAVDETGRRYENTTILRKLINAVPLIPRNGLRCSFEAATICSVPLLFPAVSFFPTTETTTVITTTTGNVIHVEMENSTVTSTPITATYSLAGPIDYKSWNITATAYKTLEITTSTSATLTLVQIPKMKGLDSTVSDELWVKVE